MRRVVIFRLWGVKEGTVRALQVFLIPWLLLMTPGSTLDHIPQGNRYVYIRSPRMALHTQPNRWRRKPKFHLNGLKILSHKKYG